MTPDLNKRLRSMSTRDISNLNSKISQYPPPSTYGITLVGNNSELYGYVISGKSREHVAQVLIWQNSPTSWQIIRARYIISGKTRQLVGDFRQI